MSKKVQDISCPQSFGGLILWEIEGPMPPFVTDAVILRAADFGERDRLVTFYSQQLGKMRGVAKGAKRSRRRFGVNLDLLAYVRIHGFERRNMELVRIEGADLLDHYHGIRMDLKIFARGCYLAEWMDGCTAQRQPLKGLLPILLRVLETLDAGRGGEDLLRIFEVKTLALAGYCPQLDRCVACGASLRRSAQVFVQVARGGVLCGPCSRGESEGLWVSIGTVRILEDARKADLQRLHRIAFSSKANEEGRSLLRAFYACHVGHVLRSTAFLESMESQTLQNG